MTRQKELEKGCGKYIHFGLNPSIRCGEKDFICLECQAELKCLKEGIEIGRQEMIKKEIEFWEPLHQKMSKPHTPHYCAICKRLKQLKKELKTEIK